MKKFLTAAALVTFGAFAAQAQDKAASREMDLAETVERIDSTLLFKQNFAGAAEISQSLAIVRMHDKEESGKTLELLIYDTGNGRFGDLDDRYIRASYNPRSASPDKKVTLQLLFGESLDTFCRDGAEKRGNFWVKSRKKFDKHFTRQSCVKDISNTFDVAIPN
jgi:hypothetical protein